MQYSKLALSAALIAVAQAIQINTPTRNAQIDFSEDTQVTWSSVNTDPSSFSIQLVNMAVNPSVTVDIADNVQTSAGSFTIPAQEDLANGGGYQINFVRKDPNNTGILTQSQQFSVTGSASDDSSSSSASSASSAASSASSSASSAASASASSAESAASSTAASISSSASAASSSAGAAVSSATRSAGAAATSASASGNGAATTHLASGVAGLGFVGAIIALFA